MKAKHLSTKVRVRKLVIQRKKKVTFVIKKKKAIRFNYLTTRHPLQFFFPLDTYLL